LTADFSNAVRVTRNSPMCADAVGVIYWQVSARCIIQPWLCIDGRRVKIGSRDASVSHSYSLASNQDSYFSSSFIVERITRLKSTSGHWAPRYGSSHKQNRPLQMYKTPAKSGLNGPLFVIQNSILIISTNSCVYVPDHLHQDRMPTNC